MLRPDKPSEKEIQYLLNDLKEQFKDFQLIKLKIEPYNRNFYTKITFTHSLTMPFFSAALG